MEITLKTFATLRNHLPKEQKLDIVANTKISQIISTLDIQNETVAIIMVNGRRVEDHTVLKENDTLSLFPPVGGG